MKILDADIPAHSLDNAENTVSCLVDADTGQLNLGFWYKQSRSYKISRG